MPTSTSKKQLLLGLVSEVLACYVMLLLVDFVAQDINLPFALQELLTFNCFDTLFKASHNMIPPCCPLSWCRHLIKASCFSFEQSRNFGRATLAAVWLWALVVLPVPASRGEMLGSGSFRKLYNQLLSQDCSITPSVIFEHSGGIFLLLPLSAWLLLLSLAQRLCTVLEGVSIDQSNYIDPKLVKDDMYDLQAVNLELLRQHLQASAICSASFLRTPLNGLKACPSKLKHFDVASLSWPIPLPPRPGHL